MFHEWPTHQIVIMAMLLLLCMGMIVWGIRKSAKDHFSLLRFFFGLFLAALLLVGWTYGLLHYLPITMKITEILFFVAFAIFVTICTVKYIKKRRGA